MKKRLVPVVFLCVLCLFSACVKRTETVGQERETEVHEADDAPESTVYREDPNWMNRVGGWGLACIDGDRTWYADVSEGGQLCCLLPDGTVERWEEITGASDLTLVDGDLCYLHSPGGEGPLTLCRLNEQTRAEEVIYTFEDVTSADYMESGICTTGAVDQTLYFGRDEGAGESTVAVDTRNGEVKTYPVMAAAVDRTGLYHIVRGTEETQLCRMSFDDASTEVLLEEPSVVLGVRPDGVWCAAWNWEGLSLMVLREGEEEPEIRTEALPMRDDAWPFVFAGTGEVFYALSEGQVFRSDESGKMQVLHSMPEAYASGWLQIPAVSADGGLLVISSEGVLYTAAGAEDCVVLQSAPENTPAETAVAALTEHWESEYRQWEESDGYLEIKNTRVIHIDPETENEYFRGIECVVEFILYSDYLGTAPYYQNVQTDDAVILYRDGTEKVTGNPFRAYSAHTYQTDYSGFIEHIEDLGSAYNQVFDLK